MNMQDATRLDASADDEAIDLGLSHNVQRMLDFRFDLFAAVESSLPSRPEGSSLYRVVLFQDQFDGLEGVTAYLASLLQAKGRVAQWIGNATVPTSIRLLVTAPSRAELPEQIRRQLVVPCATAMGSRAPKVTMLN